MMFRRCNIFPEEAIKPNLSMEVPVKIYRFFYQSLLESKIANLGLKLDLINNTNLKKINYLANKAFVIKKSMILHHQVEKGNP